jgi:hypothetical protein
MKFGAWIHEHDLDLGEQIRRAKSAGLRSIRSYSVGYSRRAAPLLKEQGMSLLAGMHIEAGALVADWRSQIRLEDLGAIHELGVDLEGICVGNELRQGGDEPGKKRFTARISFGLASLLDTYRDWMEKRGLGTKLTYAMEGIVLDETGSFHEWVWPLIDACDMVSINLYPMGVSEWHGWGAFEESRKFLSVPKTQHDRLVRFEAQLRRVLQQLETADKPMFFTETGFPSAVGYHREGDRLIIPENDHPGFAAAMQELMDLIRRVNQEYQDRIAALYFYEWADNLHHAKIWNVEASPIHIAFGLCDRFGQPKFDLKALLSADSNPG